MSDVWFSTMVRLVVVVGERVSRRSRSVLVFRAAGWPEAQDRAVELGRGLERTYRGGLGDTVSWRLETVETLDLLGGEITDGREVYAEPLPATTPGELFDESQIDPATTPPEQSGV